MQEQEYLVRRIIAIDDNRGIHRAFDMILGPRATSAKLKKGKTEAAGSEESAQPDDPTVISYDLDHAYQGEEGVEKVHEALESGKPFALAFVDIRMPPGWDGVETIRKIWQADKKVQVVVCTAHSDYSIDELSDQFRRSDSLLILRKPFEPVEVTQMANALTEKWVLEKQASMKMRELRRLVAQRTKELEKVNWHLLEEMAKREMVERKLEKLSRIDGLTNVANRRVFDESLEQEWQIAIHSAEPLSLIMLDIDHFKNYNDNYGHQCGDDCIKGIASVLQETLSRPRDLLARYGGEEFAVIMPETDAEGAHKVAEKLLEAIHGLDIIHEHSSAAALVTASAGVASIVPKEKLDSKLIVSQADKALYFAKHSGRNCAKVFEGS